MVYFDFDAANSPGCLIRLALKTDKDGLILHGV
jgi:hypothetical protein